VINHKLFQKKFDQKPLAAVAAQIFSKKVDRKRNENFKNRTAPPLSNKPARKTHPKK
jgi:hypothetical protein